MKMLFAAGGTGGHINPALAVAGELRRRDGNIQILFVGTADKLEATLVPEAGFDFVSIEADGFSRQLNFSGLKRNVSAVIKALKAGSASKKIFADFKPDIVVGFGGYVSGPVVRAAAKAGIKTAIYEINAYPGVANKALARLVDLVMLAGAGAEKYLSCKNEPVVTGTLIRSEILEADREFARAGLGLNGRPLILSTGGSLGARVFNQTMVDLISVLHSSEECYFIHAYGGAGAWVPERLKEKGVDLEKEKHIQVKEYIHNMPECLAAADIIINRAGASTLCEIEARASPAILIPSPNVTENHQYHNAMDLANKGAAIVIEEKDLSAELLAETVRGLLNDPEKRKQMGENARAMFIPDAQKKIADALTQLLMPDT